MPAQNAVYSSYLHAITETAWPPRADRKFTSTFCAGTSGVCLHLALWCTLLGLQPVADTTQGQIVPEDAKAGHHAVTHAGNL